MVVALIFVTAVGLGPFRGVLALLFHDVGEVGKLWSESIEEIDVGPIDALRVAGARRGQVVAHAVVPTVLPQFVGPFDQMLTQIFVVLALVVIVDNLSALVRRRLA